MAERLVEQGQARPRREDEPLGVVVQRRHGAPEGVGLLLVALPHVVAVEPRRHGRAQRATPLRAVDRDVPPSPRRGEGVGHPHLGLGGEGVQPGLLGGDVGGRALGVGVDPQRQAPPVVGVDAERRVVRVQHQGEVAHHQPETVGGGQSDAPQHLDLALLVEGGVLRLHPSYGMAMRVPHGTWPSPITPESLATGQGTLDEVRVDGRDTYWLAGRPSEGGRTALVRHDGTRAEEVLPAPWDVRTRVHEYGGGAYAVLRGTLVFSHAGDDRVHRLDAGAAEPVAITPAGPWRFGGIVLHGSHAYAVREDHSRDPEPANELVRLDLHGDNPDGGVVLATGTDFVSRPAVSPDGRSLAWVGLAAPEHALGLHRAAPGRADRAGRRRPRRRRRW